MELLQSQKDSLLVLKRNEGGGIRRTRKAPSARDRPASWVMTDVPSTTNKVVAEKMAGLSKSAMRLYRGLRTVRPAKMIPIIHEIACSRDPVRIERD